MGRQLLELRTRNLGLDQLSTAHREARQEDHSEHNQTDTADPLRLGPPEHQWPRLCLQLGDDGGAGRRESGCALEEGVDGRAGTADGAAQHVGQDAKQREADPGQDRRQQGLASRRRRNATTEPKCAEEEERREPERQKEGPDRVADHQRVDQRGDDRQPGATHDQPHYAQCRWQSHGAALPPLRIHRNQYARVSRTKTGINSRRPTHINVIIVTLASAG